MKKFSNKEIAEIIFESFRGWGDIDPSMFNPKIIISNKEDLCDMEGLDKVLKAITQKVNNKIVKNSKRKC